MHATWTVHSRGVSAAVPEPSVRESLRLHVPEPAAERAPERFDELQVSRAGEVRRPAVDDDISAMAGLSDAMVRVLDDDGRAVGPWSGSLTIDQRIEGLRDIALDIVAHTSRRP